MSPLSRPRGTPLAHPASRDRLEGLAVDNGAGYTTASPPRDVDKHWPVSTDTVLCAAVLVSLEGILGGAKLADSLSNPTHDSVLLADAVAAFVASLQGSHLWLLNAAPLLLSLNPRGGSVASRGGGNALPGILIYSRGVYPAQVGGREIFVADLASGLAESGHRVVLVTEKDPGLKHSNVDLVEVPTTDLPVLGFLFFALGSFRALLSLRHKVDLIHAHSPRANVTFAGFLSSFFGKALVVTAHCAGVEYAFSSAAYRQATRVVAVSDSIAKNLTDVGVPPDRVVVIPCVPRFPPAPASVEEARDILGLRPSDFVVLFLGRMDPHKGIQLLVEALRTWPNGRPLVTLLAGAGPARAELEPSWTERPDVFVRWVGLVDHQQVGTYYRAADVFVLASLREGSPLAIFEALHYGTPIVSCDVQGVHDFLRDGVNARLVARSSKGIQEALLELYDNRELLRSLRRQAAPKLSHEAVFEQHLRLYKAVLGTPEEAGASPVSLAAGTDPPHGGSHD